MIGSQRPSKYENNSLLRSVGSLLKGRGHFFMLLSRQVVCLYRVTVLIVIAGNVATEQLAIKIVW